MTMSPQRTKRCADCRGLLLLKLLNKFDGGATPGLLAEFSGLHRTTVRRLLETLQEEGLSAAAAPMTASG